MQSFGFGKSSPSQPQEEERIGIGADITVGVDPAEAADDVGTLKAMLWSAAAHEKEFAGFLGSTTTPAW